MAKGASGSQAASLVPRSAGSTGGAAAGSTRAPPTAAGLRKRTSEYHRKLLSASYLAQGHMPSCLYFLCLCVINRASSLDQIATWFCFTIYGDADKASLV